MKFNDEHFQKPGAAMDQKSLTRPFKALWNSCAWNASTEACGRWGTRLMVPALDRFAQVQKNDRSNNQMQ